MLKWRHSSKVRYSLGTKCSRKRFPRLAKNRFRPPQLQQFPEKRRLVRFQDFFINVIFATSCAAALFLLMELENLSFLCSSDNTCPSSMPALIMIDWLIDYDHGHVHDDDDHTSSGEECYAFTQGWLNLGDKVLPQALSFCK